MKKSILLDVDEVICFYGLLQAINEFLHTNYVIDDFTHYYIDEEAIPKEQFSAFKEFIRNRNLYQDAVLLPNAWETIKELNELYTIYICSSCINPFDKENSGRLFMDKYNFLVSHFPFLKPENFIFTDAKSLFQADIQIDDRISNFNPLILQKILFPSYHNQNISEEDARKNGITKAGNDWRMGWQVVRKILIENASHEDDTLRRKF